jgi:hypothetical protein
MTSSLIGASVLLFFILASIAAGHASVGVGMAVLVVAIVFAVMLHKRQRDDLDSDDIPAKLTKAVAAMFAVLLALFCAWYFVNWMYGPLF